MNDNVSDKDCGDEQMKDGEDDHDHFDDDSNFHTDWLSQFVMVMMMSTG